MSVIIMLCTLLRSRWWRCLLCTGLLLLSLMLGACSTHGLAERVVAAPNALGLLPGTVAFDGAMVRLNGATRALHVPVGPPNAELSVWVLDPPSSALPRGTIVVLHGLDACKELLLPLAETLAAAGYRAVLIDLRGHGASTGKHVTFGVRESADVAQVLDALDRQGELARPVGAYGVSLGAATVLAFAARDRRIDAVVAVASYARMRDEVPHVARAILPIPGRFLTGDQYAEIVRAAGRAASFDPDAASPLRAVQGRHVPTLLIHGAWDWVVPVEQARRLHAAAPRDTRLLVLARVGHVVACLDLTGQARAGALDWFAAHLPAAPAPPTSTACAAPDPQRVKPAPPHVR